MDIDYIPNGCRTPRDALWFIMLAGMSLNDTNNQKVLGKLQKLDQVDSVFSCSSWNWAKAGFPAVTLGHRHAASLMATNTSVESIGVVKLPWEAFLVHVPHGLYTLPLDDGNVIGVAAILVAHFDENNYRQYTSFTGETTALMFVLDDGRTLHSWHGGRIELWGSRFSYNDSPSLERAFEMTFRLLLGVVLELTEHRPSEEHRRAGTRTTKRNSLGEPVAWTYTLTRDVKVDCRQAVRDYVEGRRSSAPSVQCLVRGHWKRQAHGPARSLRKFIFVEPYWRGPEDAPIATRSHIL